MKIREPNPAGGEVLYSTLPDECITLDDLRQLRYYLALGREDMAYRGIGLDTIRNYDFSRGSLTSFGMRKGVEPRLLQKFFAVSDHLSGEVVRRRRVEALGDFVVSYMWPEAGDGDIQVYHNPSLAENARRFRQLMRGEEAMRFAYDITYFSHATRAEIDFFGLKMIEQEHRGTLSSRRRRQWAGRMECKTDAINLESSRAALTEISHVSSVTMPLELQARLHEVVHSYHPSDEVQAHVLAQILGIATSMHMGLRAESHSISVNQGNFR